MSRGPHVMITPYAAASALSFPSGLSTCGRARNKRCYYIMNVKYTKNESSFLVKIYIKNPICGGQS